MAEAKERYGDLLNEDLNANKAFNQFGKSRAAIARSNGKSLEVRADR